MDLDKLLSQVTSALACADEDALEQLMPEFAVIVAEAGSMDDISRLQCDVDIAITDITSVGTDGASNMACVLAAQVIQRALDFVQEEMYRVGGYTGSRDDLRVVLGWVNQPWCSLRIRQAADRLFGECLRGAIQGHIEQIHIPPLWLALAEVANEPNERISMVDHLGDLLEKSPDLLDERMLNVLSDWTSTGHGELAARIVRRIVFARFPDPLPVLDVQAPSNGTNSNV